MIAALIFGEPQTDRSGRVVRAIDFEARSTLPLTAACVVANGVRESLSRMLARSIDVDVIEPVLPLPSARRLLVDRALVYRARGRLCDAFVIVRPLDARRLVASAYAENERNDNAPLSDIEGTTLERIVAPLVPLCATLCGEIRSITRDTAERAQHDLRTYFEVRAIEGGAFAIGFALSDDPREAVAPQIALGDLAEIELPVRATFARGSLAVPAFARLSAGNVVRFDTALAAPGYLEIGGVRFGRGVCGVRDGRAVLAFGDVSRSASGTASSESFERGAA